MKKIIWIFIFFFLAFTSLAMAQRMAVAVKDANVRSGPETTYDILWKVEKYHPVKVLGKQGKWVKFQDFEGDHAWIKKSLLNKTNTVITTKSKCNVRSGPGKNNPVVFRAEKGVPFRVLKKKGRWLKIQHLDGSKGWIYNSLVW